MKKLLFFIILVVTILQSSVLKQNNGWSLVGSNVNDINVSTVFKECDSVWKYDSDGWMAISPSGNLKNALESAGINAMTEFLSSGDGFWVHCPNDKAVTIDGSFSEDTSVKALQTGWHLKSAKGSEDLNVTEYFSDSSKISSIWEYTSSSWKAYSPDGETAIKLQEAKIPLLEWIEVNEGFWINVKESFTSKKSALVNPIVYVPTSTLSGSINLASLGKVLFLTDTLGDNLFITSDNILSSLDIIEDNETNAPTPIASQKVDINGSGGFTIGDIPSGEYALMYIGSDGKGVKISNIVIQPDQNVTQDINSSIFGALSSVQIVFDSNESIGASVKINELDIETIVGSDKMAIFENIPQGIYRVKISKENYATKIVEINVDKEDFTKNVSSLNPKITHISGKVKIPGSLNNANAIIYIRDSDGSIFTASTNALGEYDIKNIAFEDYFIYSITAMAQDTKSVLEHFTLEQNITNNISTLVLYEKDSIEGVKTGNIQGYARKNKLFQKFHEGIKVTVADSNISTLTQRDGSYALVDVPYSENNVTLEFYYEEYPYTYDFSISNIQVIQGSTKFIKDIYLDEN